MATAQCHHSVSLPLQKLACLQALMMFFPWPVSVLPPRPHSHPQDITLSRSEGPRVTLVGSEGLQWRCRLEGQQDLMCPPTPSTQRPPAFALHPIRTVSTWHGLFGHVMQRDATNGGLRSLAQGQCFSRTSHPRRRTMSAGADLQRTGMAPHSHTGHVQTHSGGVPVTSITETLPPCPPSGVELW